MIENAKYEVSGFGSDKQTKTLSEARKEAKKRAIAQDIATKGRGVFILIYIYSIPGNPYSKTYLVEKWKVNAYGDLIQKKV